MKHAGGVTLAAPDLRKEPVDYATGRAAFVLAFREGAMPELPIQSYRQLTDAELEVWGTLLWKAHIRLCRAYRGIAAQALQGTGPMSPRNYQIVSQNGMEAFRRDCGCEGDVTDLRTDKAPRSVRHHQGGSTTYACHAHGRT